MTVVAGVSLLNGVIIAADCRLTVKSPGKADIHSDTLQKLIPLTSTSVLGFCGDVGTAALILREMRRQLRFRKRRDAISMYAWLPRFLRACYRNLENRGKARPVHFMIASVKPGYRNTVERKKVVELVNMIAQGTGCMQRNWLPVTLIQVLKTDPKHDYVSIPGTIAGLLYSLRAPDFTPHITQPLECHVLGSGEGAIAEIRRSADWILAGPPGELSESLGLREAVSDFVSENMIEDVGGMYPCLKIDQRGIIFIGMSFGLPGEEVSLKFDMRENRWRQKNHMTGKDMLLIFPWEVKAATILKNNRFDDYIEKLSLFRTGPNKSEFDMVDRKPRNRQ